MPRCHLFFPENDLALASGRRNYTPPPMAVRLRNAGLCLPLWYGDNGDRFIATGVSAAWLEYIQSTFPIDINPYAYRPEGLEPWPWGWSEAIVPWYTSRGFARTQLPDDGCLQRLRELSHRRTCSRIISEISPAVPDLEAPAAELTSREEVNAFVRQNGATVLKLPWSSSGRGLVAVDEATLHGRQGQIQGMIARQGSVMAQKEYRRTLDFAMLFEMTDTECAYSGLSLFSTRGLGIYTGNVLAPQDMLEERIKGHCRAETFDALRGQLPAAIYKALKGTYRGPLGVDMMCADGGAVAVAEMNLRNTMGHVCLQLYRRHIAEGAEGNFCVLTGEHIAESPIVENGRLAAGTLSLCPPSPYFSFVVKIDS